MFPHKRVVYETYHIISYVLSRPTCFQAVCWLPDMFIACSRTKRRVCAHFFWLMKSCLCITLNISHLVCHIIFHRCTRNKAPHHDFLTYEPFLTMQLLTYKDVSLCKLSHMRTCQFATCHIISHVLSRLPRFHTNVSPTRRVLAHVRTLQDECLHTFWLTKTCLCVTLNISHLVCHIISHRCSRNKVQHHNFLTYERFSLCNFDLQGRLRAQIVT